MSIDDYVIIDVRTQHNLNRLYSDPKSPFFLKSNSPPFD